MENYIFLKAQSRNKTEHCSVVQKIVSHNSAVATIVMALQNIVRWDNVRYFATTLVRDTHMTPATFIRKLRYISVSPECERLFYYLVILTRQRRSTCKPL